MKVLLIHGLGRSPLSMFNLGWCLQQAGHATEQFGYVAFMESYDRIVERLQVRLKTLAEQGSYGVVAHSLGGLLTRSALGLSNIAPPAHIVMLGTPNQPPRLAAHAWHLPPFQWFAGQCGFNLTCLEFYAAIPPLQAPYTIVAGTSGPTGWLSPFGMEVNDGIVALSETRLSNQDRIVELQVWHTFMMNNRAVQKTVLQCLQ
uniref:Alpha/beta hydrolase n=1 Tax=Oscillatoriales cyanobacterium SpSt-402 TaxID=2282168 RepID=A0A832M262_9CYAN